ncbi:hypothetical protein DW073_03765 [Ruminococcus sp. AF45-4BH]|nr:hypothetical protein DW073_03765 [Ruminococcus sp. AF45-4BH]
MAPPCCEQKQNTHCQKIHPEISRPASGNHHQCDQRKQYGKDQKPVPLSDNSSPQKPRHRKQYRQPEDHHITASLYSIQTHVSMIDLIDPAHHKISCLIKACGDPVLQHKTDCHIKDHDCEKAIDSLRVQPSVRIKPSEKQAEQKNSRYQKPQALIPYRKR